MQYSKERKITLLSLQIAAALIATFIIKGEGRYRIVDTEPEMSEEGSFAEYMDENGLHHFGSNRPKAFFCRIPYCKESNVIYFKPYLTWAVSARMEGPEYTYSYEESH